MKVVVLGTKGMLGGDLVAVCHAAGIEVHGYDLPDVDITNQSSVLETLPACDWVINCAAYADVDGAESAPWAALAVNRDGARRVAAWCVKRGVSLLHLSTDYVFDGTRLAPYREDDPANPLNRYGESKLAGERAVLSVCDRSLIVRTQSLFGIHGRNFVKTIMSHLERSDDPLRVVSDQTSCPTYTVHLAGAILRLLDLGKHGIVHISASGKCTWFEFTRAIVRRVKPEATVLPVTSNEYVKPAQRPVYSVLDKERYVSWTGHQMPSWEEGLDEYLTEVESQSV